MTMIEIAVSTDVCPVTKEVEAEVIGPLAVHPMSTADGWDSGLWTISHVQTGYAVAQWIKSRDIAVELARRLTMRDVWNGLSRFSKTPANQAMAAWYRDVVTQLEAEMEAE